MLIPYRVDVSFERKPIANYLLIGSILFVFFPSYSVLTSGDEFRILEMLSRFALLDWRHIGLVTHMWLHGDPLHLIGNLVFLMVFGNAICSKVGNALFIPVYLFVGLVAAITHLLFSDAGAIGASGAINGIVGMFLVFYPFNEVSCFYWILFRPGTFHISSLFIIGFWVLWDILGAMLFASGGIAYYAHLGGFVAGVGAAVLLEAAGLVKMSPGDESLTMMMGLSKRPGKRRGRKVDLKEEKPPRRRSPAYSFDARPPVPPPPKPSVAPPPLPDAPGQPGAAAPGIASRQAMPLAEEKIRFTCNCGRVVQTSRANAGKRARCPACKAVMVIPSD